MRRRMEGFRELARVVEAVRILRSRITHRVRAVEEVPLLDALGRVCSEDIRAPIDSPGFDRSALDGYAVIAEDTFGASQTNPIQLEVIGESKVGVDPRKLPR
ncbi:MAG: molybdopterin molybdenumtransferase MoeA, partial [Thaumarchaeota archaeon]|nr:molybdopterin molybdenumtransferase MoeA [Nitrososphaerota archaeon]